jgi:hypothetical protein
LGRQSQALSFTAVLRKVEGEDALEVFGTLEYFGMSEGARCVVVAGTMILHAGARELVILRVSLISLGPVDQLNKVVNFAIGDWIQYGDFLAISRLLRQLLKQARQSVP